MNWNKYFLRSYYQNMRKIIGTHPASFHKQNRKILSKAFDILTILSSPEEVIGIYYPFKEEVNILTLLNIIPNFKFALLTFINDDMIYTHYDLGCQLSKQKYGIYAPIDSKILKPSLIFVPGLAFDVSGNRIGFGKGHYDKYIYQMRNSDKNAIVVGICFNIQLQNQIPSEPHDQKMDYIITNQILLKI